MNKDRDVGLVAVEELLQIVRRARRRSWLCSSSLDLDPPDRVDGRDGERLQDLLRHFDVVLLLGCVEVALELLETLFAVLGLCRLNASFCVGVKLVGERCRRLANDDETGIVDEPSAQESGVSTCL